MKDYVNILGYEVENTMGCKTGSIHFNGKRLAIISGDNGSGKSSFIRAFWLAFAGAKAKVKATVTKGEAKGGVKIHCESVKLGKFTVSKRFEIVDGEERIRDVQIEDAEGRSFPRPQTLLDTFFGENSIDPTLFMASKGADRRAAYAKALGVDLDAYDAKEKALEASRKAHYGIYDAAKRKFETKKPAPVAAPRVDVAGLNAELTAAMGRQEVIAQKRRELERAQSTAEGQVMRERSDEQRIVSLKAQLEQAEKELESTRGEVVKAGKAVAAAEAELAAVSADAPDIPAIQQKLNDASETNRAADQAEMIAAQNKAIDEEWQAESAKREDYTAQIEAVRSERANAITAAGAAIPGLSIGEDDLYFEDVPLEQVNSAQQMVLALQILSLQDPILRLVTMKHGGLLDPNTLGTVDEWAGKADPPFNVILEWPGDNAKASVVFSDGVGVETDDA